MGEVRTSNLKQLVREEECAWKKWDTRMSRLPTLQVEFYRTCRCSGSCDIRPTVISWPNNIERTHGDVSAVSE